MSVQITITRPELTDDERARRAREVEKAAAALIAAMRKEKKN